MVWHKNNAVVVAALLAVAAMVCLGVGLRLLSTGSQALDPSGATPLRYVAALAIVGGLVVFLLGTLALLGARRFAVGTSSPHVRPDVELDLAEIQGWGRELTEIRDHLRTELITEVEPEGIRLRSIEVPESWQPQGHYLLGPDGRPQDSLADLKRTRDYLIEAAERVDNIVQNINEITVGPLDTKTYARPSLPRRLWRQFRRK